MDAVERAESGHPGAPMGLADVAEVLWRRFLHFNPKDPHWWNRDRFVLSNGHASMLQYAVLHLTGYDVSIDDIKNFRQLHSKTAGHPEYGDCPGVETTTGPLGQGLANAVGMALAEKLLAKEFNRSGLSVIDHRTWSIVGDGCLMEGISHEAASLAGTLKLGKLNVIYDDNGISIDGETKNWFTEDVAARFEAYHWHVVRDVNGHDSNAVSDALQQTVDTNDRPSLVICRTMIGYGAPRKHGTADAHGAPLGSDEVAATRKALAWKNDPFDIPASIYKSWDMSEVGNEYQSAWSATFKEYSENYPELARELTRRMNGELPKDWDSGLMHLARNAQRNLEPIETRKASGACLDEIGPQLPELLGGSADLTGSNNTRWKGAGWLSEGGRYLNYGVREFGMTAIANGIFLHGGMLPYTGTFLVFMEYARNSVRLASLMGLRQIFVYTHDSIGLGEDGPTHQPVEQLTNLRTTPNMSVWRPCDAVETAIAWKAAIERMDGPTALVLTRQKTSPQSRDNVTFNAIQRGGYILRKEKKELDLILIATGSEVEIAVKAAEKLTAEGRSIRVVSLPSTDIFLSQPREYRESVLPSAVRARVAVEAAHPDYWYRFVGLDGKVVGINRYGVSAPGPIAMNALGIHVDAVIDAANQVLA